MTARRLTIVALGIALAIGSPGLARQFEVRGSVEVVQVDDFDHGRSRLIHKVRDVRSGREYVLDGAPAELRHGTAVRVKGRLLRGVRRDGARVIAAPAGGRLGIKTTADALATGALVAGQRRAVVIAVDFSQDGKTVECTAAAIASRMFTGSPSVDALYREASFDLVSWPADTDGNGSPDVFRVFINDAGGDCDSGTWRTLADEAATAAGANLALYAHRVYVLPSSVACSWAGYAQVGCGDACWAMVSTCDRGDVYAHELGHNVGMYHASFDADNDGAVDASCPWGFSGGGEYCDDSDFMGISTNVWRQTNGPHKSEMGWIPSDHAVTVTGDGVYLLAPLETPPSQTTLPLLLRIARPKSGGYYVLSYRRGIGYDAAMRVSYADRTSVHTAPGGNTRLVRVLATGESFVDATDGVTVTQVAQDGASASIRVATTCGNGVLDPGEECDGADVGGATCDGCAGTPRCDAACRLDRSTCSNQVCDPGETCASCPTDCVGAAAACGNGVCEVGSGESCITCPSDCAGQQGGKTSARFCCGNGGTNPVGCDASLCGACTTTTPSLCCGDGICNGDETNAWCPRDCAPCTDADGDGYCPSQGDCDDADPAIRPNATEICTGGRDENCNGAVDCADQGCAQTTVCTGCLARGVSCTQGSQCCSGSCGGKPSRKACR